MPAALELITNPSSTVSCGTNEDCTVICNAKRACSSRVFYFYNNTINLQCTAERACNYAKVYTSNVTSFNLTAVGETSSTYWSFNYGSLFTAKTDNNITVTCGAKSSCHGSWFYYLNSGTTTHNCHGSESCRKTVIDAISPISLSCVGSFSCYRSGVILPRDPVSLIQSSITVSSGYATGGSMKVYSLYPFFNFTPTDGNTNTLRYIHFVYGLQFDEYCVASDALCLDSVANNTGDYHNLTIIDSYVNGFPSSSSSYNGDILLVGSWSDYSKFTAPSIPDTSTLSLLCVKCFLVTLKFGGIQNAVISDSNAYFLDSTIYGPQNRFGLNIMHWNHGNVFHMENTSTIVVNSFGSNTEWYIGNALTVHVDCNSHDGLYEGCSNTNIWSTLKEDDIRLLNTTPTTGYWTLDTPSKLLIHFDFEQYPCTYQDYTSNCSFMALYKPTTDPTSYPTSYPTSDPTSDPTSYPTTDPTSYPTSDPTSYPTSDPTSYPTSDPTSDPTSYPTADPTSNPTAHPTVYPTFDPTNDPTPHTEGEVQYITTAQSTQFAATMAVVSVNTAKGMILGAFVVCLVVVVLIIYYKKKKKKEKAFAEQMEIMAKQLRNEKQLTQLTNTVIDQNITVNEQVISTDKSQETDQVDEVDDIQKHLKCTECGNVSMPPTDGAVRDPFVCVICAPLQKDKNSDSDLDKMYDKHGPIPTEGDKGTMDNEGEDGSHKYKWVESQLHEYTEHWMEYLDNFKTQEIVDELLVPVPRFSRDDPIWEKLIPSFGTRIQFIDAVYGPNSYLKQQTTDTI